MIAHESAILDNKPFNIPNPAPTQQAMNISVTLHKFFNDQVETRKHAQTRSDKKKPWGGSQLFISLIAGEKPHENGSRKLKPYLNVRPLISHESIILTKEQRP